ncbi:MAG: HupE/UreJ family protein, partial [Deltaproteobacteria bacterium]|nr:HupE/UreJ family protein [Deltaproteobacteria bacterium]
TTTAAAVAAALAVSLGLAVVTSVGTAEAHPIAPSTLHIAETAPGVARVQLRTPTAARLTPRWPVGCVATTTAAPSSRDDFTSEAFALDCHGRALAGTSLGLAGLLELDAIAIVRVELHDGRLVREILGPAHPRFDIPGPPPWTHGAATQLGRGLGHLLGNLEHLLLLLGLLLVVPGLRARIITLAAFSAGLSLGFALAACNLVEVPGGVASGLAAASLLLVALLALARRSSELPAPPARGTWTAAAAAAIGLVHGLPLAAAFAASGRAPANLALALASYALGVQLGQLVVIAVCLGIAAVAAPALRRLPRLARHLGPTLAYGIGALAAMWCIERALSALA